jgi:hypothetical protein
MKMQLETKNAVVAKVPSGATVVLYGAVVEGDPTEAQIETGRNALAATLEIVGAANVSSYLTRLPAEKLADDETLRLDVTASTVKVSPDPLPEAEPEPLELDGENDATTANETTLDENAAANAETAVAPETSEA